MYIICHEPLRRPAPVTVDRTPTYPRQGHLFGESTSPPPLRSPDGRCRVWVGTSGYAYPEWVKAGFYPPGTGSSSMLSVYAQRFNLVELNTTWYRMPQPEHLARMLSQVPDNFGFSIKAHRSLTHDFCGGDWRGDLAAFLRGVTPVAGAGRLWAVLVQFPNSFHRTRTNRLHLARLLDGLAGHPLAVEFRHPSWADPKVVAGLRAGRAALVAVDEPTELGLFPCLAEVADPDLFYVRLHGRNTDGWYSGSTAQQFNYDYSSDELSALARSTVIPMAKRATRGMVLFNNHVTAQAPKNAQMLLEILKNLGFVDKDAEPKEGGGP